MRELPSKIFSLLMMFTSSYTIRFILKHWKRRAVCGCSNKPRTHARGYAASREQAIANFKAAQKRKP